MLIPPTPEHVVWLDGDYVPWREATMHVTAHHYGVGVFEGLRAYPPPRGLAVFRLRDHTDRLFRSAHILNMAIPFERDQLDEAQQEVLRRNRLESAYLRPFVFCDGVTGLSLHRHALSTHVIILAVGWQSAYPAGTPTARGLSLRTSSLTRHHPNSVFTKAKANGNYMNSIMALQEARACGADDALLLDAQGFVAEASGANIFIVRDGAVATPPTTSALEGITRATIWTIAESEGLLVTERPLTRDEVYCADEVFLTGTAAEVTPVTQVDGRAIGAGTPGPIASRLKARYADHVHGRCDDPHQWLTNVSHRAET